MHTLSDAWRNVAGCARTCHVIQSFQHVTRDLVRMRSRAGVLCCRPVSVRPSVTSRYCVKTAKFRITQATSNDSPTNLVFWRQKSPRNSTAVAPGVRAACRWGGLKLANVLVRHFQPQFVIFQCHTHYRASSVYCPHSRLAARVNLMTSEANNTPLYPKCQRCFSM